MHALHASLWSAPRNCVVVRAFIRFCYSLSNVTWPRRRNTGTHSKFLLPRGFKGPIMHVSDLFSTYKTTSLPHTAYSAQVHQEISGQQKVGAVLLYQGFTFHLPTTRVQVALAFLWIPREVDQFATLEFVWQPYHRQETWCSLSWPTCVESVELRWDEHHGWRNAAFGATNFFRTTEYSVMFHYECGLGTCFTLDLSSAA